MKQIWKNGVFLANVSEEEAQQIIESSKRAGYEVRVNGGIVSIYSE